VAKSMARQPVATSASRAAAAKDSDHVYSGRYVIKVRPLTLAGGGGGGGRWRLAEEKDEAWHCQD
jgi:hypothetical protein